VIRPQVAALACCAAALLAWGGGVGVGALFWERGGSALDEGRAQEELERAQERIRTKRAAALEVLANRLTPRQAGARFRELDAGRPERKLAYWRASCPGNTDEERYCWTVLRCVGPEVRHDPVRAGAARRRLEAELPGHLRRLLPAAPGFLAAVP
jgi:hypothetical protein